MRPTKVKMSPFKIWASIFNMTEGRFFTVVYRKKDGSIRRLNGRIFEKISLNEEHEHLVVTDVKAQPDERGGKFRKVDPKHIIGFKCSEFSIGSYEE